MKIAITGATGFIGRPLVERLRAEHEIVVLTRDPARAMPGVTAVRADLETPGPWCDALDGVDALIHLAGESIGGKRWDSRQKQIIRDSRVESSRTLVEALGKIARRPEVIVSASAVDFYAFASGPDEFDDDEVTEADPPADTFLGRLCRDWEREVAAAASLGMRVVHLRAGLVLGAGGGALQQMKGPVSRLGTGRQWMSWISLGDAVTGYATAVTDARYTGPINLVTESTRNAEFMWRLAKSRGHGHWAPVPAFAVRAAAGEIADYLLAGRRVVPARLRTLGFTWNDPTLADALSRARTPRERS